MGCLWNVGLQYMWADNHCAHCGVPSQHTMAAPFEILGAKTGEGVAIEYVCQRCWLAAHETHCGCERHEDFVIELTAAALKRTEPSHG